ncbi:hypothetical protein E1B28_012653 [Marasmius oreades]|uniref:Small ribosomal subunit protein mS29 n=1 Tax=Marasmius oreades TaxID=181124 RepID=A0A9P7UNH2_9AGAR|nr:uncharacterized protein E1B28_012653 [Marasmius oreades]KAG7088682.1 hypothetical protein E1B28_012653 [Marasmius oreades]
MLVRASTRSYPVRATILPLPSQKCKSERHYAKPATPASRQTNAFKNRGGKVSKNPKAFSRKSRVGTFRSMNPASLSLDIFQFGKLPPLDLPTFSPNLITEPNIGKAVQYAPLNNDPIKWFGTPKNLLLEHRLLSQRASIIRDVTVSAARILDEASETSSERTRIVLTGRPGCGKSSLLLQAVRYTLAKDWVVIYIPRARQTINSTSTYTYDIRTQTYLQPHFAHETLRRTLAVNEKILSEMRMTGSLALEKREIPSGTTLAGLAEVGVKEGLGTTAQGVLAPVILERLLLELGKQKRNPVLLAVDDFQCIYTPMSEYRDPHFSRIRPYHLSVPRLLLEYASGKRTFYRGAVVGAITASDPEYRTSVELRDALKLGPDLWDLCGSSKSRGEGVKSGISGPLEKRNKVFVEYAKGLRSLQLPKGFTLPEAAAAFEVWMKDGSVLGNPTDELLLSKYTESAGNPRDFIWKGLLSSLEGVPPSVAEIKGKVGTPWPQLREMTLS